VVKSEIKNLGLRDRRKLVENIGKRREHGVDGDGKEGRSVHSYGGAVSYQLCADWSADRRRI